MDLFPQYKFRTRLSHFSSFFDEFLPAVQVGVINSVFNLTFLPHNTVGHLGGSGIATYPCPLMSSTFMAIHFTDLGVSSL